MKIILRQQEDRDTEGSLRGTITVQVEDTTIKQILEIDEANMIKNKPIEEQPKTSPPATRAEKLAKLRRFGYRDEDIIQIEKVMTL